MVKFKNLLLEDKELQTLQELKKSEEWIFNNPPLYRGKYSNEVQDYLEFKITSERRGTKDTAKYVDTIVHGFLKSCYSEFPDRRTSRFATTSKAGAEKYGDTIFVVVPHKSANVAYSPQDPYVLLDEMKNRLQDVAHTRLAHEDEYDDLPDQLQNVINVFLDIKRSGDSTKWKKVKNLSCPDEIHELVKQTIDFRIREDKTTKILRPLNKFLKRLTHYFNYLTLGYPDDRVGEVMFSGKYFEVHLDLWQKFQE